MKAMGSGMQIGLVAAVLVVGALIAFPIFYAPRAHAPRNTCIANLKQIEGAIEQYALGKKLPATNRVTFADISGSTNKMITPLINVNLTCPSGGICSITTVGEPPKCSIPGHALPEANQ